MESALVHQGPVREHWTSSYRSRVGPLPFGPRFGEGFPESPAAVRILGACDAARDAVPEARKPAVRRPHAGGQCNRLLVIYGGNLPTPVGHERRRRGPAWVTRVRGQCRVRPRHPARSRSSAGKGPCATRLARWRGRRRAGNLDPRCRSGPRSLPCSLSGNVSPARGGATRLSTSDEAAGLRRRHLLCADQRLVARAMIFVVTASRK